MAPPSKHEVFRHRPTKVTGIYVSQNAKGVKTFECRYVNSDGVRQYEACGTMEAAKKRLAEVTHRVNRGHVVTQTSTMLNDTLDGWRSWRKVKPRTEKSQDDHVRIHIAPKFGRSKVKDITRADLRSWLNTVKRKDGREGPMSEGTKAVVLATLSSILDYAVDAGIIGVNPTRSLGKAKPRQGTLDARILADGELDRLLAACANFPWLRDIILVTLYGALRLGEACGLQWQDVDFDTGYITIERQFGKDGRMGTPKGGRTERIPMSPQMRALLAGMKMRAKPEDSKPSSPVFTNSLGGHRQPRDVQRAFDKARRYAGLSEEPRALRFHDLRHTSISMLANRPGADMLQVRSFARHANLQTTDGYIHTHEKPEWADELGAAFEAFGS